MKIALCGKMRSGKDVFADILTETYGFKKFKFSSGIKAIIDAFLDNGELVKVREYYQHIGQGMRMLDENVWVDHTMKYLKDYLRVVDYDADIVISDLRQYNEYKRLREEGFIIIKVEADEDLRIERAVNKGDYFDKESLYHETELSVDDIPYDYVIQNNGTLEEFKKGVELLMLDIFC